ncbi:ABC transporter ATP-binding protein [Candidatus Bathyarchaeota archaeon]|nr:ABC transporter ATP-binding protein [Candidatus Bathyarchaeota archaeon]
MPEVRLVNVTKRYGKIVANDNISLTIKDGEYVSVIGPSGCGKTTMIKNIAGIIKPDNGEIYIGGKLATDLPIEERGIGYVFQNIALFPHMTVWDNITYGPKVKGLPQEEMRPLALEMLEMIKLGARSDAYPDELSGGTQQKTAVARALMSRAKLLLLDEPLGALDVKVRSELRYELRKLVKDLKLTALHVTHDQEEAMSISDRVIVMKRGSIVEAGAPIDLYSRPKNIFTANFVSEANFLTGIITQITDEGSLVDVGDNLQLMTKSTDKKIGDRVVIAFRPEFASIGDKKMINKLSGTVVEVLYSGSIIRLKVRLANDDLVDVKRTLRFETLMPTISDKVTMTISPNNILVYSYPENLNKELALE